MPRKKGPPLYAVGSGDGQAKIDGYINDASELAATRFLERCHHAIQECESPIERLLVAALWNYGQICMEPLEFRSLFDCRTDPLPLTKPEARIYLQAEIGSYRVDILIYDATLGVDASRFMIVECDGHDFHEKTKEQARRDKQRDRFFVSTGYKVLRFTGSEIWADPDGVADEIVNELACNDDWRNRPKK